MKLVALIVFAALFAHKFVATGGVQAAGGDCDEAGWAKHKKGQRKISRSLGIGSI